MCHLKLMGVQVALLDPAWLLFDSWQVMLGTLPGLRSCLLSWGLASQQGSLLALPKLSMERLVLCQHQWWLSLNLKQCTAHKLRTCMGCLQKLLSLCSDAHS